MFFWSGREMDYGARYYDPSLGIFHGVDAWSEKYPSWSPFVYTMNNPIRYIDPTGNGPTEGDGDPINGYAKSVSEKANNLIVFSPRAVKDFPNAYSSAIENKNFDVIVTDNLKSLNTTLNESGKVYNNMFITEHGYGQISPSMKDGNEAGTLIGSTSLQTSNLNLESIKSQMTDLGNNVSKSGNIALLGCFTGACQYGGEQFLQAFANTTNRNVYGNEGLSYLGSNLFSNMPIGGNGTKGHSYSWVASQNAGQWTKAKPSNGGISFFSNMTVSPEGKIGFTNKRYK